MTPEQLKASILQYAIQGKLVEQKPEEGSAEDIFGQIQDEKQKRIVAGTIKKEKPLPEISDEITPFEIPDSWKWVYCRDVMRFINGRAYKKPELLSAGKYPILRVGNFFTNESWYYSDLELEEDKYCNQGDLLYAWSASFGPKIWDGGKVIYHYHIWKLDYFRPMYIKYLYYYLLADTLRIKNSSHGLGFAFVTKEFMEGRLIPIPPTKEQFRIVDKIEELLPYVDRYAESYEKLKQFNIRFPEEMKKSILQYAIQGKLVEQRPEEGCAEDLYWQIQEEKKKLIKDGIIKKEKPLTDISEAEIPFDIPESWRLCRLGDCIDLLSGQDLTPDRYNDKNEGTIYLTGASNINDDGSVLINRWTTSPTSVAKRGNLLLTCKGTIGKTCILDISEAHIARQIMAIREIIVDINYIRYFLIFSISDLQSKAKSMIPGIDRNNVRSLVLPLPPLEEQHRIVDKIEELLPYCERLTN